MKHFVWRAPSVNRPQTVGIAERWHTATRTCQSSNRRETAGHRALVSQDSVMKKRLILKQSPTTHLVGRILELKACFSGVSVTCMMHQRLKMATLWANYFLKLKHKDEETCFVFAVKKWKSIRLTCLFVFKSTGHFCTLPSFSFTCIAIDWAATFHLLGEAHNCFQYEIK